MNGRTAVSGGAAHRGVAASDNATAAWPRTCSTRRSPRPSDTTALYVPSSLAAALNRAREQSSWSVVVVGEGCGRGRSARAAAGAEVRSAWGGMGERQRARHGGRVCAAPQRHCGQQLTCNLDEAGAGPGRPELVQGDGGGGGGGGAARWRWLSCCCWRPHEQEPPPLAVHDVVAQHQGARGEVVHGAAGGHGDAPAPGHLQRLPALHVRPAQAPGREAGVLQLAPDGEGRHVWVCAKTICLPRAQRAQRGVPYSLCTWTACLLVYMLVMQLHPCSSPNA